MCLCLSKSLFQPFNNLEWRNNPQYPCLNIINKLLKRLERCSSCLLPLTLPKSTTLLWLMVFCSQQQMKSSNSMLDNVLLAGYARLNSLQASKYFDWHSYCTRGYVSTCFVADLRSGNIKQTRIASWLNDLEFLCKYDIPRVSILYWVMAEASAQFLFSSWSAWQLLQKKAVKCLLVISERLYIFETSPWTCLTRTKNDCTWD